MGARRSSNLQLPPVNRLLNLAQGVRSRKWHISTPDPLPYAAKKPQGRVHSHHPRTCTLTISRGL